jgi:hypothetical protein
LEKGILAGKNLFFKRLCKEGFSLNFSLFSDNFDRPEADPNDESPMVKISLMFRTSRKRILSKRYTLLYCKIGNKETP